MPYGWCKALSEIFSNLRNNFAQSFISYLERLSHIYVMQLPIHRTKTAIHPIG